jgi:hypothetical protein
MFRKARLLLCVVALSGVPLISSHVDAQQPAPARPKKAATKAATKAGAADPLAEARSATAVALLNALADEARNFRDLTLRARAQARAADALWETDSARAALLFRRAWDAAEAADQENERLTEEERRARRDARGSASVRNVPSMRREILRLAARRDQALGDEFLGRLDEARRREASAATSSTSNSAAAAADAAGSQPRYNPDEPPPAMAQRLTLASQLLEEGEIERAMQFADPALEPVNTFGMNFLDVLRGKNRALADERYMALVGRAVHHPLSDANTVSLLSSYVFTPYMYITFAPSGESHTRRWSDNNAPPADLSPQLREAFFRSAASILLRPVPLPEQDRTSTGRAGTYMVIARLTPLFEQYAPDVAPRLRTHLAALTPDTPERLRNPNNRVLTRGITPGEEMEERAQDILNRLSEAKTAAERDAVYIRAAFAAAMGEGDIARAKELADKVEDLDVRKQLRAFLDFRAIEMAIRAKDAEAAFRLARTGEVTNVQRAWGMTEAARLLSQTQQGRAIEMLDEALVEARRIDQASPDRARALIAIATQLVALDRPRAWEAMGEVVKASNGAADFTGEDGGLVARVQMGRGAATTEFPFENFNLTGLFAALARDDFDRAAELSKSLAGEYPRTVATIAVARTALDKKRAVASR